MPPPGWGYAAARERGLHRRQCLSRCRRAARAPGIRPARGSMDKLARAIGSERRPTVVRITVELVEVRKDRCVARRRGGRGSNDAGGGRRNAEFGDRGPGKRKAGRCDAAKAEGHTTLKRHSSQARDTLMPGRGSRAPCAPLPPSGVDPPFFRYRFSSTLHDSFSRHKSTCSRDP